MEQLTGQLATSAWVRDLTPAQVERVAQEVVHRDVPAGGFVCRTGDPVAHWFGVMNGLVKVSIASESGRWMTVAGVAAGGWFGEGSVLKTEPRGYDAIALRPSRIACVPRQTFLWLFEVSPPFTRFLVRQLNERCGQFLAMLEADRLLNAEARVARCIRVLFNPVLYPGTSAHVDLTQEEIGELSGLSRQHTNKALHRLEERGLLRVDHRGVTVIDLQRLQDTTFDPAPS